MLGRFAPLLLLLAALALTAWLFLGGDEDVTGDGGGGGGGAEAGQPSIRERARTAALPARAPRERPEPAGDALGDQTPKRPAGTLPRPEEKLTDAEKAAEKAAQVSSARRITPEERKRGADLAEAARGAPAAEAREEVKQGLLDDSEYVRLQALQALTRFKSDGARDIHDHLLVERSEKVQEACVHLLGRHGDESMIEELGGWSIGKSRDLIKAVDKARRKLAQRHDLEQPERLAPRRRR